MEGGSEPPSTDFAYVFHYYIRIGFGYVLVL